MLSVALVVALTRPLCPPAAATQPDSASDWWRPAELALCAGYAEIVGLSDERDRLLRLATMLALEVMREKHARTDFEPQFPIEEFGPEVEAGHLVAGNRGFAMVNVELTIAYMLNEDPDIDPISAKLDLARSEFERLGCAGQP